MNEDIEELIAYLDDKCIEHDTYDAIDNTICIYDDVSLYNFGRLVEYFNHKIKIEFAIAGGIQYSWRLTLLTNGLNDV